jgi:hypothetical protein
MVVEFRIDAFEGMDEYIQALIADDDLIPASD